MKSFHSLTFYVLFEQSHKFRKLLFAALHTGRNLSKGIKRKLTGMYTETVMITIIIIFILHPIYIHALDEVSLMAFLQVS